MKNYLILILFSFCVNKLQSQNYIFPINKNVQNYLSGNLGELRGDHFHMGIDIKTFGKINLPVYASENGYVERLRVSGSGYGKAIYLVHDNGEKTVYAHLNKFNKLFDNYVTNYQYKNKKFVVNIYPGKKFYVTKGDIIGYSGNSGGSSGPHLHFEYRDSLDNVYDPLKLNFSQIQDIRKPTIDIISFKTMDLNSKINNGFGIFNYKTNTIKLSNKNIDSSFYVLDDINIHGKIGISILTYDRLDGYLNKVGINRVKLFLNDSLLVDNKINVLSYAETNFVARYIDFNLFKNKRKQFIKLYQDDGNRLNFHNNESNGILDIDHSKSYKITIEVFDSFKNKNSIEFNINKSDVETNTNKVDSQDNSYQIIDNTLVIKSNIKSRKFIEIQTNNAIYNMNHSLIDNNYKYYLIDLKNQLPKKVIMEQKEITLNFIDLIPNNKNYQLIEKDFDLSVSKGSLFDTLYLSFEKIEDSIDIYKFKNLMTFKKNVKVSLKPSIIYEKENTHVYDVSRRKPSFIGGKWTDNNIIFNTKNLSHYSILSDTVPPKIKPIKLTNEIIKIKIEDDLSGIKSYEGKINNQWVLFEYDNKNDLIISKKINSNQSLKGKFVLIVVDNANNKMEYNINI